MSWSALCGIQAAESETVMERKYYTGQPVVYVDSHGVEHDALITKWWAHDAVKGYGPPDKAWLEKGGEPGCNLVYVVKDVAKSDPYGHQIERATSVTHQSSQSAPGNYWKWHNPAESVPILPDWR